MAKEEKDWEKIVKDLAGYCRYAVGEGKPEREILSSIVHDLRGLVNDEPCFLPLTQGHEKHLCLCGCGGFPEGKHSRFMPGHDEKKEHSKAGKQGSGDTV